MDYREMRQLGDDPWRVRSLAAAILEVSGSVLSAEANSFLATLKVYEGEKPLSTRQLEYLSSLRELASKSSSAGGYSASELVRQCWEARFDLNDDDAEEWLDELKSRWDNLALTRGEWRRLIALAKQLHVLPPHVWVDL